MKVREGDRFTLPARAQLRVLYFQSGRQERYTGPASFSAGREAGSVHSGAKPQVTSLPTGVPQRIARVPELLQNAKLGGVQLRGNKPPAKPDDANLREARALYERLRKELPRDDITPELFLYSALSDYHRYDEMRPVVDEMLRKQPDNEELKALAQWVRSQPRRVK
jgi:tetratricopeptide (TPR) repeat protein